MMMVIIMHTIYNFTIRTDFFATKLWFILEPIVAISKVCVLLFFMLSGYLVIGKNRSLTENWQKTKKRVMIPLVFFSTLNLIYTICKTNPQFLLTGSFWQAQLVKGTHFPSSPLWFLVVLLFFYLLNPLWQKVFNQQEQPGVALYLIKLSFFFSILVTILQFPSLKSDIVFNNFTAWTGFLCFYLYGGAIKNKWLNFTNHYFNYSFLIIGFSLTLVGDFVTSYIKANSHNFIWTDYTANYLSIPVIMMAIGLFNLLISDQLQLNQKISDIIQWLAGLSFGIYLIHSYVVSIFTDFLGFDFNKLNINVYLYNLLNVTLVFLISLTLTWVIKKIPKMKMIIGE